ncbi:MAG: NAD(+)/NADH kinase [Chloroflexota bacterium]|nr:NAD(+)/NADH kinase [Chloroflexota bacterium]
MSNEGFSEAPVSRVGLVAARGKAEAGHLAEEVEAWLVEQRRTVIREAELTADLGQSADAIVVLGGDGLMMRAANMFPDVPLLGINFGNVGFLALVERRDWRPALEDLLQGRYAIEDGATLAAAVVRARETIDLGWAINDVVVRAGSRMIDMEVYIDDAYVNTYPGDGMIVSTPHGSTAYCMAAGGPILTAGVRGLAIVPISCHSPIRTPLIVSEQALVELVLTNDRQASLVLDGRESFELKHLDVVEVRLGEHRLRLVTLESTNFYEAFRTKFNFRIRPDVRPTRASSLVSGDSGT